MSGKPGAEPTGGLRHRLFPVIWLAVSPLRLYVVNSPISRGKGFLLTYLLLPLLPPPPAAFKARLARGGSIMLGYRESIGLSTLLRGAFEPAEIDGICSAAGPGSVAIDVGANVGVFTACLARAVGDAGKVWAFEPVAANVERLHSNILLNGLLNVEIKPIALGASDGSVVLRMASDAAFSSTAGDPTAFATGSRVTVPVASLDRLWREAGRPAVSAMKIDVEGSEPAVLDGSREMLAACKPALLIEANTKAHLAALVERLSPLGYRHLHPAGFTAWNHFFVCG